MAPVPTLTSATSQASSLRRRWDELRQDVRYAWRAFRRAPAISAVAVLTVALGLGATTAIFGLVNVTFLAPLPFDPDNTLVRVREFRDTPGGVRVHVDASRRTADAIAERRDLFRDSVVLTGTGRALALDTGAVRVEATRVGPRFASVLGVQPVAGRVFSADEERAGEDSRVAVISHRLWTTTFGGEAALVGGVIRLDGQPFTVIGVLPAGFHVPFGTDVWFPSRFAEDERSLFILARLAPGVTVAQAAAALEPVGRALREAYPDVLRGLGVTAVAARDYFAGEDTGVALALMAAVTLLLLIACSNVTLLLAARFATRRHEVALRAALGCGRARQVRQFVTEALLLFLSGGALGVFVARWVADLLVVFLPEALAAHVGRQGIPLDARLLAFAMILSVASGVAFGVVAAFRSVRTGIGAGLHGTGRALAGTAPRRLLATLVAGEVALAVVLLTGAGVTIAAFQRLQQQDLGFATEDVLTFRFDVHAGRFASPDVRRAFVDAVLSRLRALPGVSAAGATTVNPLCCGNWGIRVTPEGHTAATAQDLPVVQHFVVTEGYVDALAIRVVEGRAFTHDDTAGAEAVVLVDGAFAERFWPGQRAVGKRVKRGTADSPYPWLTVVGVVETVEAAGDYAEAWYLPYAQHPSGPAADSLHVMMRASGDPSRLARVAREAVAQVDPAIAVYAMRPLASLRHDNLRQHRLGAVVTACFGVAGLLLAALGLYGVVSVTVAEDRRELGVRLALGAQRSRIAGVVLVRGLRMTLAGLLAGGLLAWLGARLFAGLVGDPQLDAWIILTAAAALTGAACAALVPTIVRALTLSPLESLRGE